MKHNQSAADLVPDDPVSGGARAPMRKALLAAALAGVLALILVWTGKEAPVPAPPALVAMPPLATMPAPAAQAPPAAEELPAQDAPTAPEADLPDSAPAEAAREPVRIVASPAGHVLQLGVFGAQQNAERRRDELVRAGFGARIESRVVLGPYADRTTAEQTQEKLRAAGLDAGIVVPPRAP